MSLAGLIDVAAEVKRLEKQIAEKQKHLQGTQAKLANAELRRARRRPEVVQQQRDQVAELEEQIRLLEANLAELRQ